MTLLEACRSGIAQVAASLGKRFGLVLLTHFCFSAITSMRRRLERAALIRAAKDDHSNRLSTDSSKRRPWIMATISMRSGVIAYNMR